MRRLPFFSLRTSLVCASAVLLATSASPAAVDYSGVRDHAQIPVQGSWIVSFESQAAGALEQLVGRLGGEITYRYEILPDTWNVRGIDDRAAARLSEAPGVTRVVPDYEVGFGQSESVPLIGGMVDQKTAAGFGDVTGAGVRICIVDTGVRHTHIVFEGRSDTDADVDIINNDLDASDDNGHGTHVAGTAAGGDGFTVGGDPWQGVAHEATIVAVKALNASGGGTVSGIVAGIDHCADQGSSGGRADVINLSLGGGLFASACDNDPMAAAANNAVAAGLVVVAAAGNDCYDGALSSPACGSKVMAVGATWDEGGSKGPRFGCYRGTCADNNYSPDDHVCFSNKSSMLSVAAPGAAITSSINSSDDAVGTYYGTSQATPHVAGLAALLLDQNPATTPAVVRKLIEDGAVDVGDPGFDTAVGHGRIDVISSLEGSSCGDLFCDSPKESSCSCPVDCGAPPANESVCDDGIDGDCDGDIDCFDLDCQGSVGCGCGSGTCDPGEDSCSCPVDCGLSPDTETDCSNGVDDDCDGAVDGDDSDCTGGAVCGDKICEGGTEDCGSCPTDCRAARGGLDCCGDGQCTGTEKRQNCPADCT